MIITVIVQYTITVRAITVRGNTEDFTCGRAVSFEIDSKPKFLIESFTKFLKKKSPKKSETEKIENDFSSRNQYLLTKTRIS